MDKFNTLRSGALVVSLLMTPVTIFSQNTGNDTCAAPEGMKYLQEGIPENWEYCSSFTQTLPSDDRWWQAFGDHTLDSLVDMAVNNNFNLAMTLKRLDIARNNVEISRSGYYPSLGMSASWTKGQSSGRLSGKEGMPVGESYFNVGLQASWEIDVFGRITAGVKEKKFDYKATRAEYAAAMVSLCGTMARDYISLRSLQAQLSLAKRHIETQKRIVALTEARLEAGIGSMLDVTQARIVLYNTQATIPSLEVSIHNAMNSISMLAGYYPGDLPIDLSAPAMLPDYHQIVGVGVPMELLRRRPDIVEAEYRLASAAAALGVSRKDFMPTLSITGEIATTAHDIGDLFGSHSLTYSVVPTLSWTIFSGMSRKYNVANARKNMELEIDNYNLTVMNAVSETDNAIDSYLGAVRHIGKLSSVVEQSEKSMSLSVDLYKQGLTNFSNVSDAQLSLLESQSAVIVAQGDALTALINLYEALGGGWYDNN